MGRQIVYYSVLWVANYQMLRTTALDAGHKVKASGPKQGKVLVLKVKLFFSQQFYEKMEIYLTTTIHLNSSLLMAIGSSLVF